MAAAAVTEGVALGMCSLAPRPVHDFASAAPPRLHWWLRRRSASRGSDPGSIASRTVEVAATAVAEGVVAVATQGAAGDGAKAEAMEVGEERSEAAAAVVAEVIAPGVVAGD